MSCFLCLESVKSNFLNSGTFWASILDVDFLHSLFYLFLGFAAVELCGYGHLPSPFNEVAVLLEVSQGEQLGISMGPLLDGTAPLCKLEKCAPFWWIWGMWFSEQRAWCGVWGLGWVLVTWCTLSWVLFTSRSTPEVVRLVVVGCSVRTKGIGREPQRARGQQGNLRGEGQAWW